MTSVGDIPFSEFCDAAARCDKPVLSLEAGGV